jgi:hypothetical protein
MFDRELCGNVRLKIVHDRTVRHITVAQQRLCDQPPDHGKLLNGRYRKVHDPTKHMLYQWLSTADIVLLMMGTEGTRNVWSDLVIKSRYWFCILLDISCVYV